ncbi:MAG: polymer-forming cytoskeletal protein [Chloroflexota bacterium]
MKRHLLRGVLALGIVALLLTLGAASVLAFEDRGGDTVTVDSGETLEGDVYLAGRTVTSRGTIDGDLFAAGQTVAVNGDVNGGVSAGGQTVSIIGQVGRGVRAAGQSVDLSGDIGGDALLAGAAVTVAEEGRIGRDLGISARTVTVAGEVHGQVKGGAEEVTISGEVHGDVHLEVDRLVVSPGARIDGDLVYESSQQASIPADAHIGGEVRFTQRRPEKEDTGKDGLGRFLPFALFAGIMWQIVGFLVAFVTGLIVLLLLPRRLAATSDCLRTKPGPSAGWGAVALFATPLAAIVICLTILGFALGVITLVLWGIAIYLSQIPVALLIGVLVLRRSPYSESKGAMIGGFAIGLVILALLRLIPVVGFFVGLATVLFGMGAVVVEEKRRATVGAQIA